MEIGRGIVTMEIERTPGDKKLKRERERWGGMDPGTNQECQQLPDGTRSTCKMKMRAPECSLDQVIVFQACELPRLERRGFPFHGNGLPVSGDILHRVGA